MANFESNIFRNSEDMVPKIREILQMFACQWPKLACLNTKVCKINKLCRIISSGF